MEEKTFEIENLKTSKRQRRIESKKNKIKAFLEVAKANENDQGHRRIERQQETMDEEEATFAGPLRKKRRHELTESDAATGLAPAVKDGSVEGGKDKSEARLTPEEELKKLRAECIARKKKKMQQPLIFLTDVGTDARFRLEPSSATKPLSATDVQQLFLTSLYGGFVEFHPKWCRFLRWAKCSHRVVVLVEGASAGDYRKHVGRMRKTQAIFEMMVEVSGSAKYFDGIVQELLWIATTSGGPKTIAREPLGTKTSGGEASKWETVDSKLKNRWQKKTNGKDKFSRLDLLLSPKQMLRENYPFVPIIQGEGWMDFEYTKDSYLPATTSSPLFAVDCEMCITTAGASELTRVSVVDEKLNTVYDTFVKPDNEITNYLTQFSGVTRALLKDVEVRLSDVQRKIRNILPPDAVLCGQSLNCDLHALKMVHPYVIDTSVVYNLSGIRRHKSGLKLLSKIFLKEDIQSNRNGHDSVEDAKSVMKLVLLKLSKGIDFGDVILYDGDRPAVAAIASSKTEEKQKKITLVCRAEKARSTRFQAKKSRSERFCVDVVEAADNEDVVVQTRQRAIDNDVTIARLDATEGGGNCESFFSDLDDRLSLVFDSCAPNALLVVVFGDASGGESLAASENGLCMIRLKLDVT